MRFTNELPTYVLLVLGVGVEYSATVAVVGCLSEPVCAKALVSIVHSLSEPVSLCLAMRNV